MAAFQVMNQDFLKLDRFDGTNFTHWQDKMMFLLTALKVQYVLNLNLLPLLKITENDSDQTKVGQKKREEDKMLQVYQMDIKTAFLNDDLDEEVYMEQPEGFVNERKNDSDETKTT
ncbi:hypothetical protein RJ639_031783 [Escallonia herrerae]|uniref:Reverse transcriptase Ty1/copia-type domain-containing protein n=1 Tax=Escallonia herrerae TaxID=1293975 RepID=A0AA89BMK9_9ASTE|nr:hypothetical protein RJ639_031783 [Escallonia herrerae]